ncbi:NGP1NT-domain-containing protein [Eremomyces bilateralis CBS 781.70]|uniref:Nucleolar GTP-binding protein 2 n=1 Tax=Eremomyces bilateralis CBS 781.70 TaxID=1392243 RepID=A0A6G1GFY5_9PEZI|nr:NGP1NT-domain-containing protein [Eremomyces bilateralis CBS 781.70]KAF1816836.1 NGP1NT-domain-containing protein [Eremomyces bilateralis CBS 781.70]
MGQYKKEAARKDREGKIKGDPKIKGENFYRNAKKLKTLNMFNEGKAERNASGRITKAATFQSRDIPNARVEPHRKWFTNSRVISQTALNAFRDAVTAQTSDPYSYLLKRNKIPMTLIRDNLHENGVKKHKAKMALETMPFSETFGPKARRKKVQLDVSSMEDFAKRAEQMQDDYDGKQEEAKALFPDNDADGNVVMDLDDTLNTAKEAIFSKGQSKRIWNELYKVIDSSDVIIHVLDARDPLGTRCRSVEKYIREEAAHKHLLFALNKCDLVPSRVAVTSRRPFWPGFEARWVKILSKEYPTMAFRSSITNPFGKGALINVLRQFSSLHKDRRQISVGFIGYPNTGKSSMINALRSKKVCTVAPIPGETKEWQYITLMKRIYLIDCPGVVPPSNNNTDEDILLRGVVRVERVEHPEQYIDAVLKRCRQRHVELTYEISGYNNSTEFLEMIARKRGRLLKGGEADLSGVAKLVLNDFLRGKLPWCTLPPGWVEGPKGPISKVGGDDAESEVVESAGLESDPLSDEDEDEAGSDDAEDEDEVEQEGEGDNDDDAAAAAEASEGQSDFEGFES